MMKIPGPLLSILLVTALAVISQANEIVYTLSSSYGQLVTSSTLRYDDDDFELPALRHKIEQLKKPDLCMINVRQIMTVITNNKTLSAASPPRTKHKCL